MHQWSDWFLKVLFNQHGRVAGLCLIVASFLAAISTVNTVKQGLPPPLLDGPEFSSAPSYQDRFVFSPPPSKSFALPQSFKSLVKAQHERFDYLIEEAAQYFAVDFHLIKAIIKAESEFNPRAVSRRGARGLMQVMPCTARELGVGNLFDPRVNIFAGVQYYKQLLTQLRGDHRLALAAYNAGISRVKRCGGIPPIPATRSYLAKVLDYAELYRTASISSSVVPDGRTPENPETRCADLLKVKMNRGRISQVDVRGKTVDIHGSADYAFACLGRWRIGVGEVRVFFW